MKIVFSDHAKKQRVERKIPKKYILETIQNPQNKLKSFKSRELRQREFSGKILEVVIITEEGITTVITQYWLERKES